MCDTMVIPMNTNTRIGSLDIFIIYSQTVAIKEIVIVKICKNKLKATVNAFTSQALIPDVRRFHHPLLYNRNLRPSNFQALSMSTY